MPTFNASAFPPRTLSTTRRFGCVRDWNTARTSWLGSRRHIASGKASSSNACWSVASVASSDPSSTTTTSYCG